METELNKERDEDGQSEPNRPGQSHEGNAVTKFLTEPTHRDATTGARRLHEQLARHARTTTGREGTTIEPTFITGKIKKGIKDGDPCTTHQDAYENHLTPKPSCVRKRTFVKRTSELAMATTLSEVVG